MSSNKTALIADTRPIDNKIIDAHMQYLHGWDLRIITDFEPSIAGYNRLLTSRELWESLPEHVLVFQQDSELFKEIPDRMLEYDFVGAAIPHIGYPAMNGGLSLRNTEAMLAIILNVPYNGGNEDMYFCNELHRLGFKLPDYNIANQFSVETLFNLGSCGAHSIEKYLTPSECEMIRGQYV